MTARRHGRVAFHTALLCTRPQCTAAGSYRGSFLRTAQYHECESCLPEAQRSNAVLRDVIWISSRANSSRLSGLYEAMSRQATLGDVLGSLKQTGGITSMYTLCASTIIEGPSLARPPVAALSALRTSVVIQKHHTYHNNG